MLTAGSAVFIAASPLGQAFAALLALAVGLSLTLPAAVVFERWVDLPAIALARALRYRRVGAA